MQYWMGWGYDETIHDVWALIDEHKYDEWGPIPVTPSANLCEGSVSSSDQNSREKLKIEGLGCSGPQLKYQKTRMMKFIIISILIWEESQ
jgi:hypothetical protein